MKKNGNMIVAIAASGPETGSQVSVYAARIPWLFLFNEQGDRKEAIANPVAETERGAAPKAAAWLKEQGVGVFLAGDFGPRLIEELEAEGIKYRSVNGTHAEVIAHWVEQ